MSKTRKFEIGPGSCMVPPCETMNPRQLKSTMRNCVEHFFFLFFQWNNCVEHLNEYSIISLEKKK